MVADRRSSFAPPPQAPAEPAYAPPPESTSFPLGVARGQVAKTYIVAEAEDGLVIVDQHAAHERLVLERMRAGMAGQGVSSQTLLRSEEHTSELQSLMRTSFAVFCLKKKQNIKLNTHCT